jgi:hypothetical protein
MPQNRENRAISSQIGQIPQRRLRNGYEERSKDEAPPKALDDTHACRAPPRGPRLAREALLGGSQGLDRLNSTKIAESGQIRAWPQKRNIKNERPRAGPERPHHPPHHPPRGPMDAPRWAKAPHDQPTCPSPPAPACYAHAPVLTGEKNLMGGVHAETKHKTGGAYIWPKPALRGRPRPPRTRAAFGTPSSIVGWHLNLGHCTAGLYGRI